MVGAIVGAVVAGLVLLVSAFAWTSRERWVRAQREELARRIGPSDTLPQLVASRQADGLALALGSFGMWLHALRGRAGRGGSAWAVVLPSLGLATVVTVALGVLLRNPVALVGLMAGALPVLWLLREAEVRGRKVTAQLPDALDLVARAMRAGHAFVDALQRASEEIPSPLGTELRLVSEQHRLGLELRPCLDGLVERVPASFELRLLVGAVLLNRETGGNLIEILEHLAETVRERLVFESKVQALTAEVRASATILVAMPFLSALALSVVQPGYLSPLLHPGFGQALLGGGVVSMTVGILLMRRLAQVEL